MSQFVAVSGWVLFGASIGGLAMYFFIYRQYYFARSDGFLGSTESCPPVSDLTAAHFRPLSSDNITISERRFPFRVRADLQQTIDRYFCGEISVSHFCGVKHRDSHEGMSLTDCLVPSENNPAVSVPPQNEAIDVGDKEPIQCLKNGLWFAKKADQKFVILLAPVGSYGRVTGIQFQIATANSPAGTEISKEFFKHLEESVLKADSYRGKILSLEQSEHSYTGEGTGIKVHKLRYVEREQVILPHKTLDLLDRNVIQFSLQRKELAKYRVATKKGILFYGPPGTGKTHTIHYLSRALTGHTTLLVTAEQIGLLSEYMTLARLLQPSIVVMEDVDLIAGDRSKLNTCEEVLLNKLLNEMDGLNEEADILFLLTTNRPETLEAALASRPGRVDQAIEFPLPDAVGRRKLVRLYSQGFTLSDEIMETVVRKTEKVSAAFIKELMRRSVQFHLESNGTGKIELANVENALDEMLFSGGSLNLKMLGAEGAGLTDNECEVAR